MSDTEIDLGQDIGGIERGKTSDIIPKGEYLAEVTAYRGHEKDGKKSVVSEYTIKADLEGGKWVDSQFIEFFSLAENALWKHAAFLDACFGQTFKGQKVKVKDVIGKRITIRTFIDDYQGRDSTKVNKYMPASKFSGGNGTASTGTSSNEDVKV